MLRVLAGYTKNLNNVWLRGSVKETFTYDVEPSWFNDPIVREALLELDDVVDVNGVALIKSDGLVIPPDWLSHGCKQFISMTVEPDLVCDGFYFGWNVIKFFYKWSEANSKDVTILLNDLLCLNETLEMKGILLNNGKTFKNNKEMAIRIADNRRVHFFGDSKEIIKMQKFNRDENDVLYNYGKIYDIKL